MRTVCKREACSNPPRPPEPGKRGRPPEYCSDECKHLAELERRGATRQQISEAEQAIDDHDLRRTEIQERAEVLLSPLRSQCDCGRPIVIAGDYECALCSARAKRAGSRKTKHLSV